MTDTPKSVFDEFMKSLNRAKGIVDDARKASEREGWLKQRAECEAKGDRAGVSFCDFMLAGGGK